MKRWVNGEIESSGVPKTELGFEPLQDYEHVKHLVRVAKRWALTFCTVEAFGDIRRTCGGMRADKGDYVRSGIWFKMNAQGQMTGDRPAAAYEGIACMHRFGETMHWNGKGSYGFWACNGTRGEPGRHPNQKPLRLCLELVRKFSNPGEMVLDPFCGSGRIGEACMLTGRRYLGVDSDPVWVAKAQERLEKAARRWGVLKDAKRMNLCTFRRPKDGGGLEEE
jgi:hypothetical protein